ncbi:hypothetical protein A6R68_14603 [Neotoma lepida]|uniref:Uncharacterized protein n=1 Tax=Neotoma lepida TaxID=56216 RepID=A0A1A6HAE2_NEOLE|nr:hypothetical protein A6R68_14603 [Neotoma lepida]
MENSSGKRSQLEKILEAGKLRVRGSVAENWRPSTPSACTIRIPLVAPFKGTTSARMSRGRRSVAKTRCGGDEGPGSWPWLDDISAAIGWLGQVPPVTPNLTAHRASPNCPTTAPSITHWQETDRPDNNIPDRQTP